MKKSISTFILLFLGFISFSQTYSATDSVIITSTNDFINKGRGFTFTPKVDIAITKLGKRIPNDIGTYTWTIWNNESETIVHSQVSMSNTAEEYTYETISKKITLFKDTLYSLILYGDNTEGSNYYFGPSTQINEYLTYGEARYCNDCDNTVFPTSQISDYHYGTPDFHFTICTSDIEAKIEQNGETLSTDSYDSYQWINCDDNTPISGSTNSEFTPTTSGSYSVIINDGACIDTTDCSEIIIAGINDVKTGILNSYPNPSQGEVTIDLGSIQKNITIDINDALGQNIVTNHYNNMDIININLEGEKGIYFVKIYLDGSETPSTIKLIKE